MIQKQPESMVVLVMFQLEPEATVFGCQRDAPSFEGWVETIRRLTNICSGKKIPVDW